MGLGVLPTLYRAAHGGLMQLGCQTLSHVTSHHLPWPHLTGQVGQALLFLLARLLLSCLSCLELVTPACACVCPIWDWSVGPMSVL